MSDRWAILVLLIVTVMVQLLTVGEFSSLCDEGLVLTIAERLGQGETLYREVDCFLPPLIPLFFLGFFGLFGPTIKSATLALALIRTLNVTLVYAISRRLSGWAASLTVSCCFMFGFTLEHIHANYHWAANIPYLGLVLLLLLWKESLERRWLVAVGFCLALTALTLHTYSVVGTALILFVLGKSGLSVANLKAIVLGAFPPVAAFCVMLAVQGSLAASYDCLISENSYRMQYEQLSLLQSANYNLGAFKADWLQALSIWLPLLLSVLLPILRPNRPAAKILMVAHLLLLAASAYRLLWQNVSIHFLLSFPILAAYLEETNFLRILVVTSLALCLPQAAERVSALVVERHWVQFPRGQVFVSNEFEASKLTELKDFLLRRAQPGQQAVCLPYVPHLNFLMGYRNPNPVVILRPISVPREKFETAIAKLNHAWVFRFRTYDSAEFLTTFWPNCDMAKYESDSLWFHEQLQLTHQFKDCGALLVYRPLRI